jgi:uncharacterized protein (TIGR03067 family)
MPPLLLALALAAGTPNLKDPPPKDPPLVGRWECTGLTISGRADPQWRGLEYEFTAAGGWVIYRDGRDIGGVARTYAADPKPRPAAADLCERADGVAQPSPYKVEGDTLTLAIRTGSGGRPTDFEPADGVMTFVFRRAKAGK